MKSDAPLDPKKQNPKQQDSQKIYSRAQEQFQHQKSPNNPLLAASEQQQLMREVQIYQLALEMQSEELRTTLAQLEALDIRYGNLFEWAPVAYLSLDKNGDIIQANKISAALFDGSEALAGRYFGDFLITADIPVFSQFIKQVFMTAIARSCELSFVKTKNALTQEHSSTSCTAQIFATLAPDKKECLLVLVDITARKKIDEELRTTTRLLEESQAIAKVGSAEMNLRTNVLFWTRETYRIHDTTPEEFNPSYDRSFELYPPESRERIARALQNVTQPGQIFDFELEKYTTKGRRIDLRTTCNAGFENGELVSLTSILQDITERKQAERRQQHHNRILEMLATQAPLVDILNAIAIDVERINPNTLCSILLLDDDGQHLRHGAAPSLPEFYIHAIDGLPIGPATGSCGSAAYLGERVIVEDIQGHPWWASYSRLTQQADLGSCWSQPIISGQGRVLGTFAIYHRRPAHPSAADLQLIESEAYLAALAIEQATAQARLQLAASVFTHAREGILIADAQGNIVEVNDTFIEITGYSREEVVGENPRLLQSGRHGPEFYAAMWQDLTTKGHWDGEIWNKRKNGEIYAQMMTISVVRDNTGKPQNYVNLFTDITPLKEHQHQLEYIAHYDALTNLPNRVLLADRLKQAILRSHRGGWSLAVMYIDLDGFKAVNDTYGHDVGDKLLVTIAHRLKDGLREGDTLARIGGDEFVVVLVDLEIAQDYEAVLQRLLAAASEAVIVDSNMLRVSASIGVTLYPQDDVDADQLMRHADQAMYIAKQAGKNCFHLFDVARDAAVQTHRESLEYIRLALERHEFVLYYQPKVNMKTGMIIGAEALVRWQHPLRGLLLPAAFLPIIENDPISIELGEWVIGAALAQMSQWRAQGLEVSVAVNVGALQLQRSDFAQRLAELLALYHEVPPHFLELEILETSALEDITEVAAQMHACRELGVRFAVDDFGTGYSSLTYLKRLPANLLKIDQSFIRDMLDDPDDLAIVKGVIGLAHAFHREVIAEGVETTAHGAMLLSLGCDLAQGYGIGRPMAAIELPHWAATWKPDSAWTSV